MARTDETSGLEVIRVFLLGEVLAVYAANRRYRTGRLSTAAAGQHTLEYPIPRDKVMIEGPEDVYTDRDQYRPWRGQDCAQRIPGFDSGFTRAC